MDIKKTFITAEKLPSISIVFLFLAPLIVLYYGSFVFNPANIGNVFLYILLVVADFIAILTVLSLWITIFLDVFVLPHHRSHTSMDAHFLESNYHVDVFITTAGEPFEIVKNTLVAALAMEYPHKTFVLDDGRSKDISKLCEELGAIYVQRDTRRFAKAGNINNGLLQSKATFFAIFDADHVPDKKFLLRTLPHMQDEEIVMVQTPQHFVNRVNYIAAGTAIAQEIFYRYLSPAKNISDSAFCVGTNVLFRRSAIDQIGGIAEISHSEDIWTSRMLHEKGWKTLYVNEVLAKGKAPETINAYFRQQLRWAKGGFGMLFLDNPLSSKKLHLDQKIQYFAANAFYLIGFSMLIYLLLPIFYLLFGISPLKTGNSLNWLLHYLPYIGLYYGLTWLFLGRIRLSLLSTALAAFYPYILAFFSILFNTQENWTPTTSQSGKISAIMVWIWPHVLLIVLSIFSLAVGWFDPLNFWDTFMSSIWVLWNTYLLLSFLTTRSNTEEQEEVYAT